MKFYETDIRSQKFWCCTRTFPELTGTLKSRCKLHSVHTSKVVCRPSRIYTLKNLLKDHHEFQCNLIVFQQLTKMLPFCDKKTGMGFLHQLSLETSFMHCSTIYWNHKVRTYIGWCGLCRNWVYGALVYDQNQVLVSGTETKIQFCSRIFLSETETFFFKKFQKLLMFFTFFLGI